MSVTHYKGYTIVESALYEMFRIRRDSDGGLRGTARSEKEALAKIDELTEVAK